MPEQSHRKELTAQYKEDHPEAGVYCIRNLKNSKVLLASSPNLASIRNKVEFAKSMNMPSTLDYRLKKDITVYGLDAFSLEILEVLEIKPESTDKEILDDLAILEELWREKFDPDLPITSDRLRKNARPKIDLASLCL